MSGIPAEKWASILDGGCVACASRHTRLRVIATGTFRVMAGEPVSSLEWTTPVAALPARAYRAECSECRATLWESSGECPLCDAAGGLARVVGGRSGAHVPATCPRCGHDELRVTGELRAHASYVQGKVARRVADARPGEDGWHPAQADCPSCEETVASLAMRCGACGRSSLVRGAR